MTGLLVSVRNAQEAKAACEGGATLIDVKEPARGSLGAADIVQWHAVRRVVPDQLPVSVALGELVDQAQQLICTAEARDVLSYCQYAKVGLSQCGTRSNWRSIWKNFQDQLPRHVKQVAVIYADYQPSNSPPPDHVLQHAKATGCHALLVDTFDKSRGDVFSWFAMDELAELAEQARRSGLKFVLAGSLGAQHLPRAAVVRPDFIAVRGAACEGPRTAHVSARRVRDLAERLKETSLVSSFRN